jgi:hypothetical protein
MSLEPIRCTTMKPPHNLLRIFLSPRTRSEPFDPTTTNLTNKPSHNSLCLVPLNSLTSSIPHNQTLNAPISRRRSCPARRRARPLCAALRRPRRPASTAWLTGAAALRRHQDKTAAAEGWAPRRPPRAAPGRADRLAGRRWRLRAGPAPRSLWPAAARSGALRPLPSVSPDWNSRSW